MHVIRRFDLQQTVPDGQVLHVDLEVDQDLKQRCGRTLSGNVTDLEDDWHGQSLADVQRMPTSVTFLKPVSSTTTRIFRSEPQRTETVPPDRHVVSRVSPLAACVISDRPPRQERRPTNAS